MVAIAIAAATGASVYLVVGIFILVALAVRGGIEMRRARRERAADAPANPFGR